MPESRIFTFQFIQQRFTKYTVTFSVDKDNTLFTFILILFQHFTEFIQLIIQYLAVAHSMSIIQQFTNMKVYLNNATLSATFHNRLRFGFVYHCFLKQS